MSEQEKKDADKKKDTEPPNEIQNAPGTTSKLEVSGVLGKNSSAPVPAGASPAASGNDLDLFEQRLQEYLDKNPAALERVLAKHPTLVQLEKLAAEMKAASATAKVAGNIQMSPMSPIEAALWSDFAEVNAKVREAKAKNPFQWQVETRILVPPSLEDLTDYAAYFSKFRNIISSINGVTKPPSAYEASLTTATSGAAMGVDSATPMVVVPTQYPAQLRDTCLFGLIPQGADRKRFAIIKAYGMGALTEATEPTEVTDTLATTDVLTTERGGEKKISFIAQRKLIGPVDEGVILALRLGELYDEDTIIFGGLGVSGISGLSDISLTTPGDGNLAHLAGLQYGDGTVAADNTITSTMTMKEAYLATAVQKITAQGISPDGLVAVMSPKQFRDLMEDSNIVRYLQWHYPQDSVQALISRGFIPELHGVEIRRSTLVPTVTITSSGTGYECYIYKKQYSVVMAASQDVLIESFRNIQLNATVYKAHYQLGTNIFDARSVFRLDTA